MREVWKTLILPSLEKYWDDVLKNREEKDSWPQRAIFSDVVKPFNFDGKEIKLWCVIPPAEVFWSSIIAMYILWGGETFPNHGKCCNIFLQEMNRAQFKIGNLTECEFIVSWLIQSSFGNKENVFLQEPVWTAAELVNCLLIAQSETSKKTEKDLGHPDEKLVQLMQDKYDALYSKWFSSQTDDGQGKTDA